MLVLGVDVETTGLDVVNDRITEIGAVLWDTETGTPVRVLNELVQWEGYVAGGAPAITPEIAALTGISQGMIDDHGMDAPSCCVQIRCMLESGAGAVAFVAHNGTTFDRPLIERAFELCGETLPALLWVDTCTDVDYPERIATRRLTYLAAEHGFVNDFGHRAVFDVLTMLRIAQRYPWAETIENARQPSLILRALVTYDEREKAKAAGFRWDAGTKTWRKVIKGHRLEAEVGRNEFGMEVVG